MHPLIIALATVAVAGVFLALSLAALIDPQDPALQPQKTAPARRATVRRQVRRVFLYPPAYLHPYPHIHAHIPASDQASQPIQRRPHMHTHIAIRWLSIFMLTLVLGGATAFAVTPAHAADGLPSATVSTGRLNVRTGPGVSYTVVTRIDEGQSMSLLARNSAASWVKIRLSNNVEGWVNASYIQASVAIADLPVNGAPPASPAPAATGTVTAAQLDLRSGPSAQNGVVTVLRQGQALTLLGRTADSAWVKVRAGSLGEGWVQAQVIVRLPGDENGVATATFSASVGVGSLPVVGTTPATPSGPRVSVSGVNVKPATPVFISVAGFPANRDIAAVLTSRNVPAGFVVANGRTDASGNAQLFFRQPDMWPSGAAINEASLSLAVGTTDGAVLVWNGLAYTK